jgi:hypothetical protein
MMGVVYWIMKGLTAAHAVARMKKACLDKRWATADRQRVLDEYERLMKPEKAGFCLQTDHRSSATALGSRFQIFIVPHHGGRCYERAADCSI